MTRVLFDTNVVLDVLLRREPFWAASAAAIDTVSHSQVDGYVAAHAVTTIAYLLQRNATPVAARNIVAELLVRLRVAAVTDSAVRLALASSLRDFEDAVCDAASQEAGIETIVTRNVKDFAGGVTRVMLPEVFLAGLTSMG